MKMGWKSITGLASVIGTIVAILLGWNTIKEKMIYHFLDDYHEERKGGFRTIIADGLGKTTDEVPGYLINVIKTYENVIRIGPVKFRNDIENLYYIDVDGKKYTAFRSEGGEWYKWDNSIPGNDKWVPVD